MASEPVPTQPVPTEPVPSSSPVVVGGEPLTASMVCAAARGPVQVVCTPAARARVEEAWHCVTRLVERRPVYGRTTGVGANRSTTIEPDTGFDIGMLRSHATASGVLLDEQTVRAGMLIRLHQITRGGSGLHPDIIDALMACLALDTVPAIHATGSIGTGDLGALGELALTLMGELPFRDGITRRLWTPHVGDALPILSSNAFTAAVAVLGLDRARLLAAHTEQVAALSLVAMHGATEAIAEPVARARPHAQVAAVAARQRELVSASDHTPARVQDSYGLRALPQVCAALHDAIDTLDRVLGVELNAAPENPLVAVDAGDVYHHGNFHAVALALALDGLKLAVYSNAALALTRLTDLSTPGITGLAAFLGDASPGSNGVMLLEYNAAAALSGLRHEAAPASLGSIVISRGVENHSSFATQAGQQLLACTGMATDVLACELLAAHRAVVMQGLDPAPGSTLHALCRQVREAVAPELRDRSLTDDLARVRLLLTRAVPVETS